MIVLDDGRIVGTIGGGRVEKEVIDAAVALLADGRRRARPKLLRYHLTHELAMCCGGEMEVFVEPLVPAPPLVVCGGGHVARALVPLAKQVGFSPIVVEEAEEMATPERFPDAARIVDSFDPRDWKERAARRPHLRRHRHARSRAGPGAARAVHFARGRELAYLGLIGSRRKIEMFKQRLDRARGRRGALRAGCTRRSGSTSAPRRRRRSPSRSSPS